MKKFISLFCTFLFSFLALCTGVHYAELYPNFLPSKRVYEALRNSKQKSKKVKRLIIGDSVGGQLFDAYAMNPDSTYSLACNQAIDIIGQYILLYNFLEANEDVEEVYLVYNPFSFKNNLDHEFTYNYFLKPFYKPENEVHFTENALKQIEQIPYNDLVNFPPVAITFWTPEVKTDSIYNPFFLSDTSVEYLQKMQALAQKHQVKFKIVSPPIKASRKKEVARLYEVAKRDFLPHTPLAAQFDSYFNEMMFLDDAEYVDQIHLKNPSAFTAMVMDKFDLPEKRLVIANEDKQVR